MRYQAKVAAVLLSIATIIARAQSAPEGQDPSQDTQTRGFWNDPSTGLMWAGKDNGKDVNWHKASKYCRKLLLQGYSDWRLPTLGELEGIYDKSANAPGFAGKGNPVTWHVKGNLFLTGDAWSTTHRVDDRGRPIGLVWYFDFGDGRQNQDDSSLFGGFYAGYGKRALCVRLRKMKHIC